MVKGIAREDKHQRFALPPWNQESEEWLALDERLPKDHPVRRVVEAVDALDLEPLFDSYLGVGRKALRPDLLLKLMLYELHNKRPSPAAWAEDVQNSEPVRWLLWGAQPSRSCLYTFRDRIVPFLAHWNAEVVAAAVKDKLASAKRAALDSSSVAAHAARRGLLNEQRLQQRRATIDAALERRQGGQSLPDLPRWLAPTERGLRRQKRRYQLAAIVLQERQAANARRRSTKRKSTDKILVSPTDPEAALARDKLNVFRPLYSPQLLRDLDSPLILAYAVRAQNNDHDVLGPMVEQTADQTGCKPEQLLVDSGYVSMRHLEFCAQAGITLYGPCQENDFSQQNGKKTQRNQHTELPKSAFRWLREEQTYQCPEGHRLRFAKTQTQQRTEHEIELSIYTCPGEHCSVCPRQQVCTRTPAKGRSVSRMNNEELLDALRARMQTAEAKRLYKLRSQTVELNFADLKEHRGLRRFHGLGLRRAAAEVGALVLTHNLLYLARSRRQVGRDQPIDLRSPQIHWAA